jgi:transcriptional regulator with XRE-family HTH domain
MEEKNEILFSLLGESIFLKASNRLKVVREILKLSVHKVSSLSGISTATIERIESGKNRPTIELFHPLIFFYGFTLPNFFNFDKPLPSADKLKAQLIKFHKAHGSDAYIKLFKDPKLIDLLEEELIPSGYFETWRDVPEVQQYCHDTYGYHYPSATGTLNTAVEKGWLVVDDAKPKRYKQGPKAPNVKK